MVNVVAGFDRPAHFVGSSGAMGKIPARAGIVLAVAIERAKVCHGHLPKVLFTADAACSCNMHAAFQYCQSVKCTINDNMLHS